MGSKEAKVIAAGAISIILSGVVVKFANLPGRVSVLESQFVQIDKKLDQIIVSLPKK